MHYLFLILFLILSYLLPFGAMQYSFVKFPPANVLVWQSAMEAAFIAMFIYLAVYIIRFFISLALSIYLLRCFDKLKKIYLYNTAIFFVLFLLDNIILKIIHYKAVYNVSSLFDYVFFMLLCSLWIVYFPLWLVFGIRNIICKIKMLKNNNFK